MVYKLPDSVNVLLDIGRSDTVIQLLPHSQLISIFLVVVCILRTDFMLQLAQNIPPEIKQFPVIRTMDRSAFEGN